MTTVWLVLRPIVDEDVGKMEKWSVLFGFILVGTRYRADMERLGIKKQKLIIILL